MKEQKDQQMRYRTYKVLISDDYLFNVGVAMLVKYLFIKSNYFIYTDCIIYCVE